MDLSFTDPLPINNPKSLVLAPIAINQPALNISFVKLDDD